MSTRPKRLPRFWCAQLGLLPLGIVIWASGPAGQREGQPRHTLRSLTTARRVGGAKTCRRRKARLLLRTTRVAPACSGWWRDRRARAGSVIRAKGRSRLRRGASSFSRSATKDRRELRANPNEETHSPPGRVHAGRHSVFRHAESSHAESRRAEASPAPRRRRDQRNHASDRLHAGRRLRAASLDARARRTARALSRAG